MAKDAWTQGYQRTQAEYLARLKREANRPPAKQEGGKGKKG